MGNSSVINAANSLSLIEGCMIICSWVLRCNSTLSHVFIRDYEQALLLAKTGMASYPNSLAPRRILIATLVEMDRLDEAKIEVADFLAIDPDFRLSTFRNTPYQDEADQDRYFGAMRAAGIPD